MSRPVLGTRGRWIVTVVSGALLLVVPGAALVAAVGGRWVLTGSLFAAAMVIWWCCVTVVTGYSRATPGDVRALGDGPLWHLTKRKRWASAGGLPGPGTDLELTPRRCRPWALMFTARGLERPRRAVYLTRVHPDQAPRWGMPTGQRDFLLEVELADVDEDLVDVHLRPDGAVAFAQPVRVTVRAVSGSRVSR